MLLKMKIPQSTFEDLIGYSQPVMNQAESHVAPRSYSQWLYRMEDLIRRREVQGLYY